MPTPHPVKGTFVPNRSQPFGVWDKLDVYDAYGSSTVDIVDRQLQTLSGCCGLTSAYSRAAIGIRDRRAGLW